MSQPLAVGVRRSRWFLVASQINPAMLSAITTESIHTSTSPPSACNWDSLTDRRYNPELSGEDVWQLYKQAFDVQLKEYRQREWRPSPRSCCRHHQGPSPLRNLAFSQNDLLKGGDISVH